MKGEEEEDEQKRANQALNPVAHIRSSSNNVEVEVTMSIHILNII